MVKTSSFACFAVLQLPCPDQLQPVHRGGLRSRAALPPRDGATLLRPANLARAANPGECRVHLCHRRPVSPGDISACEWIRGDAIYWLMMSKYGRAAVRGHSCFTAPKDCRRVGSSPTRRLLIDFSFALLILFRCFGVFYVLAAITCLQIGIAILIPKGLPFSPWPWVLCLLGSTAFLHLTLREWTIDLRRLIEHVRRKSRAHRPFINPSQKP